MIVDQSTQIGRDGERYPIGDPRLQDEPVQAGEAAVNVRHPDFGAVGDGVTDDTAALQAAFDYASGDDATTRVVVIPKGWYRFEQLRVPIRIAVRGEGWGNYGTLYGNGFEEASNSFLQQLPGVNDDAIIFDASYVDVGTGKRWVGPVGMSDLIIQGHTGNTSGGGIVMRTGVGLDIATVLEGVFLKRLGVNGFAGDGVSLPGGALPIHLEDLEIFMNEGYGIDFEYGDNTQAVYFEHISGDQNGLGLIRLKGLGAHSSVNLTNIKSEKHENQYRPGGGVQENAIVIEDCTATPIVINGLTHLAAVPDGGSWEPPGAAIKIVATASNNIPHLSWNAVGVRIHPLGESGTPGPVLVDATNSRTVPNGATSGTYGYNWTPVHVDVATRLRGALTPNGDQWTTTTVLLVAGRGYFGRFRLTEPLVVTSMAFTVTSFATNDDAVEVAIFNSAGVRLATSGSVTGKLNTAAGLKSVPISVTLPAGTYYSGLLCPAVGGTAATVVAASFQRVEHLQAFGTSAPRMLGCQQAGLAALPDPIVPAFLTSNVVSLAVRE